MIIINENDERLDAGVVTVFHLVSFFYIFQASFAGLFIDITDINYTQRWKEVK